MPEVTITTGFGNIKFAYEKTEELTAILKDLDRDISAVLQASQEWVPQPPRSSKIGYEEVYRFLPNGRVELMAATNNKLQRTTLVLFAYDPETISEDELRKSTGIADPGAQVLQQTSNKAYFRKDGARFGLSEKGLTYVRTFCPPKTAQVPTKPAEAAGQRVGGCVTLLIKSPSRSTLLNQRSPVVPALGSSRLTMPSNL
jgi:hypothetical protein